MNSSVLKFGNFKDYERKTISYLHQKNLLKSFEECRINGIKKMIDKFDLTDKSDVKQLAYVLWLLRSEFEQILDDYLMTKINLDMFAEKIIHLK